jgi:integrase
MAWTKPASSGRVKGCWRDHTGRERSKTFATKTEALKYARKMEVEIDAGVRRDLDLGKMTVGEWMAEWLATSPKHRAGTRALVDRWIRLHVRPTALAKIPLYKLRPIDIDRWVTDRIEAGVGRATIKGVHGMVNAALNRAVDREIVPKNPARRASIPEYVPKPKAILSVLEIVRLSKAVEPRYRALVLVLGFGGIRVSEASALTVNDLDEQQRCLWVTRQLQKSDSLVWEWSEPKSANRKRSPAMLPEFVVQALREHIAAGYTTTFDGETLIFSARRWGRGVGGPLHRLTVNLALRRGAAAIGLPPGFHTHNLRDSCATNMLAYGASVVDVADQLGDKPETVLATYIHSSTESRRAALSRIAAASNDELRPVLRPVGELNAASNDE